MPQELSLELSYEGVKQRVLIWHLIEDIGILKKGIQLTVQTQQKLARYKTINHQKELLGVRQLLVGSGYLDEDLIYLDNSGKPSLKDETAISITHTQKFSAIALSKENPCLGIDIEKQHSKLVKIANRFLHSYERVFFDKISCEILKIKFLSLLWTSKEALYKYYNISGLSFSRQIHIVLSDTTFLEILDDCSSNTTGTTFFKVLFQDDIIEIKPMYYHFLEEHTLSVVLK